ncbi:MAG: hypothetical protein V1495_05100 [Pseudomonadota bacterium]
MKAMLFILVMAVFLLVLQTALMPRMILAITWIPGLEFVSGHTIDFALITLVYLVFHRDLLGALLWAAIFSILAASFGTGWRGAAGIGYFAVALGSSFVKKNLLLESRWSVILLTAGITLFEGFAHLWAGHIFNRIPDPLAGQWGTILTQAGLNALAAPLLYSFLYFFDGIAGGRTARRRHSLLADV